MRGEDALLGSDYECDNCRYCLTVKIAGQSLVSIEK
jgi:hypothetical protein